MKRTVTVLQDDIDNGRRNSADNCAIALAAKRDLFLENLWVDGVSMTFAGTWVSGTGTAELPAAARQFVTRFDGNLEVEPFKFEIDVPDGAK